MKAIKILTNPYTLIISFLMIIISGEHTGGFYISYLLLALPHFANYAVLAVVGIALMLLVFHSKRKNSSATKPVGNLIAILLLLASVYIFFYTDVEHYN